MSKYADWSRGQDEALLNKLGGDEVARRLLTCNKVAVEFKEDGQAVIVAEPRQFKIWRTIKVGTGLKTADDFRQALKGKGYWISDPASDVLAQEAFTVATKEAEVDLALVPIGKLGFRDLGNYGTAYGDICARILRLNLELCEPEDGPQLRLQYPDQPKGEWVVMAMKALRDSDGHLRLFYVEHHGNGRGLYGYGGDPDDRFDRSDQFVVRVPRKQ